MRNLLIILLLLLSIAFGQNPYSLYFDGDDWAVYSGLYRRSDNQGTWAFWFKVETQQNYDFFISSHRYLNSSSYFGIRQNSNTVNTVVYASDYLTSFYTELTYNVGEWQHVIIKSDGSSYEVKLNGTQSTLVVAAGDLGGYWHNDIGTTNPVLVFGSRLITEPPQSTHTIKGWLDEIYYFSAPTTDAQDAQLWNNGTPRELTLTDNLVDYWSFNEGTGDSTTSTGGITMQFGDGSTSTTFPSWSTDTPGWDYGEADVGFINFKGFKKLKGVN